MATRQEKRKTMERNKKKSQPVKVEQVQPQEVTVRKTMTLDEIEQEMMKCLSVNETSKVFLMSQKFDMLQKFAAYKLKRMEIEQMSNVVQQNNNEPLQVVFVNSKTDSEKKRIEKLENAVRESRGVKEDA